MRSRPRIVLICTSLIVATLLSAWLVQRQTALLPEARAAATRPTVQPERQLDPSDAPAAAPSSAAANNINAPTAAAGAEVPPPAPPRAAIIDRERFFFEPNFNTAEIQAFLETQAGPLKNFRATVGDREHSFAEILGSQTSLYSINPKVVLALIEQQSGMITSAAPSDDQQKWMLGFRGEEEKRAGWVAQVRWAIRELHRAQRDFPAGPELTYADQTRSPLPPGLSIADYAIARVLAQTTSAADLPAKLDGNDRSFVAVYTRLFGDPRDSVQNLPPPAEPFLSNPMGGPYDTQSFFDHESPFLQPSGDIVTYRGDRSVDMPYDGHDGWDLGMLPPNPILAAADGTVIFAGNSDDGCGIAKAVIIDHGNGYRTLYWHLTEPTVETGQQVKRGEQIGIVGSSGCVTGPHLHFQVQYLGRDVDPYGWCGPSDSDPWATHPAGQRSTWLWRDMPSPCNIPQNAIMVDTTDPGFRRVGAGWSEVAQGIGGTALNVTSRASGSSALTIGVWRPELPRAGTYRVLAWVPYWLNGLNDAKRARYVVGHADGSGDTQEIAISQNQNSNGWADLGTYTFDPARKPFVGLNANDTEAGNNVWYDAVIWIPVDAP